MLTVIFSIYNSRLSVSMMLFKQADIEFREVGSRYNINLNKRESALK